MDASRRRFLTVAGVAGAGAIAAPSARSESRAEVRWKMTSAFQPKLDLIAGGAQTFARNLAEMTDQAFQITVSPPGEIASAIDALDAVAAGRADCAHTALSYSWNRHPAWSFGTGAPFGMNARQHFAWLDQGGGNDLINALLAPHNLAAIPLGDTGGQMAGWFRKEIHRSSDLSGLKVRIGGFAGKVFETLGATLVNMPKDEILPALSKGTLDGFEWIGPYDDERFNKTDDSSSEPISRVAPYYYYPGWWKGGMQLHLIVARNKLEALPGAYQSALRGAAAEANASVRAKYDAANPGALKRLVVGGAELRLFPQETLEAFFKASNDLLAQLSEADPNFKRVADAYWAFRADEYLWWQVQEYSFDNFMIRERRSSKS